MPARSPARSRTPASDRVTRGSARARGASPSPKARASPTAAAKPSRTAEEDKFAHALTIYLSCVGTLGLLFAVLVYNAPAAPSAGQCDGVGFTLLLSPGASSIVKLWSCSIAYQESNWWFVLGTFVSVYLGLKMFAIPATFALCVLAGALFPMWLSQLVNVFCESVGSSMCYLLSSAIARPIVERLAPQKLGYFREHAEAEREHMFLMCLFTRLTPFLPNWFLNVASPLVGVPLTPFFLGSFFGTQLGLFFLGMGGSTLREVGESGFDLGTIKRSMLQLSSCMLVVQLVPLLIIRSRKRRKAEADAKLKAKRSPARSPTRKKKAT